MALNSHREPATSQVPPFLIAMLLVAAALFIGVAIADLVVPFQPEAGWSAFVARMWF